MRVCVCVFVSNKCFHQLFHLNSYLNKLFDEIIITYNYLKDAFLPSHVMLNHVTMMSTSSREGQQPRDKAPMRSILPYFKIRDWKTATPIMQEFEMMAHSLGLPNFGWTWEGDNVVFRSSMMDPDKLISHYFESFSPLIDKMIERAATIDRLEIHSAPVESSDIKTKTDQKPKFKVEHFEMEEGWFTNMDLRDDRIPVTMVNSLPRYTIKDEALTRPLMKKIMDMTHEEKDCLYFGWTKQGNTLACQAAFRNGEAMANHYKKVDPLLSVLLDGPATLDTFEIHGSEEELAKTRDILQNLQKKCKEMKIKEFSSTKGEQQKA
mmetsp:Transcript_39060/g.78860  ORF Transcript_39060/g.78860 Transcript_39060/m.78860 type:complete len:321 (+) Transcript_39060:447-1409(+)